MRTPKRKNHPKGFTLMELLVVVAIIAVLIAIAIPVFTASLEQSRAATGANIRSDYAQAALQAQMMSVMKEPTTPSQSKPVVVNEKFSVDPPPPADLPAQTDSTTAEHIHSWGDISYTWSTETGVCTAVKSCKTCPEVLRYTSKEVTVQQQTPATCTQEGSALLTATFEDPSLNTSLSVKLPTIDHVRGEPVLVTITDSTCTAEGSGKNVIRCINCQTELSSESCTIPKKDHVRGEPVLVTITDSTCTAEGSGKNVVRCTNCQAELSSESCTIPKKDHVQGDPVLVTITDSTCTAEGSGNNVIRCINCQTELSSEPCTIPKKDHVPGDPVQVTLTAPTCIAEGSFEKVVCCKNCSAELSRQKVTTAIDSANHVGEQVRFWSNTFNENGEYPWRLVCMSCGATIDSGFAAEDNVPWDSLDKNDGSDRWSPEEQEPSVEGE